jgi:CxxC motif-containing protein
MTMVRKRMICITCPNGCPLDVEYNEQGDVLVKGALCRKGEEYGRNEILNPVRILTTSVKVKDGQLPLVSVRTSNPIPKGKIQEAMGVVRGLEVSAPVHTNQVLVANLLDMGVDLVATREVGKRA